jgi:hypothetical protein
VNTFYTLLAVVGGLLIYWTPTIVAWRRRVPNLGSVAVVNFFSFFLLVPWVIALAMAARSRPPAPYVQPGTWPQLRGGPGVAGSPDGPPAEGGTPQP